MINSKPTNTLRATLVTLLLSPCLGAYAQATAPTPEETVELPQFTITESQANRYQSQHALSASRVAMPIIDIPQTVSIITNDFIQDSMSGRMLDAAKYVTPVVESTLPVGGDRYTIRGFQVSHEFIDGMVISGEDGYSMSIAPYNIDRIEVIKGPNAVLVPGGAPGGQFNPITKSPLMKDESSATLELGSYFADAVSFDTNRVLSKEKGIAVRAIGAIWDSKGYQKNSFRRGYEFAPSVSWQLSPANKLTIKAEFVQNREIVGFGLPIDPSVGSDGYARIATGLPRDWSFGNENDHRHRRTDRITAELLSSISDHISARLMLSADHILREDQGGTSAAIFAPDPVTGALVAFNPTRNPYTGKYEPGVVWTVDNSGPFAVATSTPTPLPNPSTYVYHRVNGSDHLYYNEAHLRNDYAFKFDRDFFKSTTVTGLAGNFSKTKWRSFVGQLQGPDLTNATLGSITYNTPYVYPEPSPPANGQNKTAKLTELQLFAFENIGFFHDRLLLSGGVSRYFGTLTRTDTTGVQPIATVTRFDSAGNAQVINVPTTSIDSVAKSYGVVVKPIKEVGLFYSHNSSGEAMPGSLQAGNPGISPYANPPFKPTNGKQDEYGVKTSLLKDTLTFSIAHFNISQTNYAVPNSEYYVLVSQGNQAAANALATSTFLDVNSKGWEAEGTYALNKNLTVIGNISSYKYRQPTGVRIRAVPDHISALYLDYRFTEGTLNGFGFNVGVDSKSDMVGESVTALTTTKPLVGVGSFPNVAPGFVPQQASYKYAGRTLLNLGFTYHVKNWSLSLQINNALDKDYILAGGSRTAIVAGNPRNLKSSFTYRF